MSVPLYNAIILTILFSGVVGLYLSMMFRQSSETQEGRSTTRADLRVEAAHYSAGLEHTRQLEQMLDRLPVMLWTARPDGYIDYYNLRWYEYTGMRMHEAEGWGWQSVHDPEVLPLVLERWEDSLATGEPFEMEFPIRSSSGEFCPFLTRVVPVKDAQGRVKRWLGTNTQLPRGE